MKILAIGAHPDDIEMYCGGIILKLFDNEVEIVLATLTGGKKNKQIRIDESNAAWEILGVGGFIDDLKSGYLKHDLDLVSLIDETIEEIKPDIILSHCLEDYHQDHRAVALSVRSALRGKDISWITYPFHEKFGYFRHNLVVDIADEVDLKREMLECFKSQKDKWYMKQAKASNVEKFRIERMVWGKLPLV